MRILKNVSTHCYMLESAQTNETWGRCTFLGFNPKLEATCLDGMMRMGTLEVRTDSPSRYLRQILASHKSPRSDHLPPFTGGWWDISPMNTSDTASPPSDVPRRILRASRM